MTRSLALLLLLPLAASAVAAEPRKPAEVAAAVDKLVSARLVKEKITPSDPADDAEFLRRLHLDLTGRIPTPERAAEFLDSTAADKRAKLIDELLDSPGYAARFAGLWYERIVPRVTVSERIDTAGLRAALAADFAANRPWGEQVARLVRADDPGYVAFHRLNGDMSGTPMPNANARAFARLFLGVRLECAECHHDPARPWRQEEFWGLAAFFGRAALDDKEKGKTRLVEAGGYKTPKGSTFRLSPKDDGSLTVHAEAWTRAGDTLPAKLPGGERRAFKKGDALLPVLAEWTADANNPYLPRAAVNRLWADLLGRGLAHPADDFHADAKPAHPEALDLLTAEFTAGKQDLKHLIRCVCLTQAYQRGSRPKGGNDKLDDPLFARAPLRTLTADQLLDSLAAAFADPDLFPENPKPPGKKLAPPPSRKQVADLFRTDDPLDGDPADYGHGIPQVLRLLNTPALNAGGRRVAGLVVDKLSTAAAVETLYLATLSRRPTPAELKRKLELVAKHPTPRDGLGGVLWTLVNGAEFVANH